MDNLRALNGFMGQAIIQINDCSDTEIDKVVNGKTFRDYIEAFSKIPERFANLPVVKTMIALGELGHMTTPPQSEDEAEQFAKEFFRKLGIDDLDTMSEDEFEDLVSAMDIFMDVIGGFYDEES